MGASLKTQLPGRSDQDIIRTQKLLITTGPFETDPKNSRRTFLRKIFKNNQTSESEVQTPCKAAQWSRNSAWNCHKTNSPFVRGCFSSFFVSCSNLVSLSSSAVGWFAFHCVSCCVRINSIIFKRKFSPYGLTKQYFFHAYTHDSCSHRRRSVPSSHVQSDFLSHRMK